MIAEKCTTKSIISSNSMGLKVDTFRSVSINSSLGKRRSNGSLPICCERSAVTLASMTLLYDIETKGSFSTYAKFSEKLTFLNLWYAHVCVRIRV